MCLRITHVPATRRDGLIVPAVKSMWKDFFCWRTGILSRRIPRTGWLLPHAVSTRKYFRDGDIIEGCFIHGYCDLTPNENVGNHEAFAVCVEAYQEGRILNIHDKTELACRAMYIPEADMSFKSEATIATLNEIKSPVGLVKAFPFLKKYVRSWLPKNCR